MKIEKNRHGLFLLSIRDYNILMDTEELKDLNNKSANALMVADPEWEKYNADTNTHG